jgi:hypothetical protein
MEEAQIIHCDAMVLISSMLFTMTDWKQPDIQDCNKVIIFIQNDHTHDFKYASGNGFEN